MPNKVNQSSKGNPASHRMSNAHRKAYMEAAYAKRQKRKEELKAEIKKREERNRALTKAGRQTPWEWAKEHGKTAKAAKNPQFQL